MKLEKPTDNAVIESFLSTLKKECVHRYVFETKKAAKVAIDSYIFFYNYYRITLKTKLTPYEVSFGKKQRISPKMVDNLCS